MNDAQLMQTLLVIAVVFLAVFTQSLAGFGVALVAMALLPGLLGLKMATPLVALVAVTLDVLLLLRYRRSLRLRAVLPLILASLLGIPLGILALVQVDEALVLSLLGVVIAGYALYALSGVHPPRLHHPLWAYLTGLLAGMLGGAYNTSGPPVIVYGDCQRWPPAEFKGNLQGFFLVSSLVVVLGHALAGNLGSEVWRAYLWSLPALGLGVIAGTSLDKRLDPARFRKLILLLLVLMGVRLALSNWL